MSPKVLDQVLAGVPRVVNQNVLVGFDTSDDAGVYKLTPECALVQTLDFFTPIVDDAYMFGAIAAANSLSDIYAMGGSPITALSIVAFPAAGDLDTLAAILKGGADKLIEADCAILGGHSVNDDEIKFGYAVTGLIHPERVQTNAGARPGDALVFTKSIGTGVISTAIKRRLASDEHARAAIESMLQLNRRACEVMIALDSHGCTDISGFGLLGHAREMAVASNVTIEIDSAKVRFLPGAIDLARAGAVSAGLKNNREFVSGAVDLSSALDPAIESLLYDPQTSGGLLVALPPAEAAQFEARVSGAHVIGQVLLRAERPIRIL